MANQAGNWCISNFNPVLDIFSLVSVRFATIGPGGFCSSTKVNYASLAGKIGAPNAQISKVYPSPVTPAGFAFRIPATSSGGLHCSFPDMCWQCMIWEVSGRERVFLWQNGAEEDNLIRLQHTAAVEWLKEHFTITLRLSWNVCTQQNSS